MKFLTFEQIKASADRPSADIEVPEWRGSVRIRALSGLQRDKLFDVPAAERRFYLLACSLVDGNNEPLVSADAMAAANGKRPAAVEALAAKASFVLDRLTDEVLELNQMNRTEELEKNSGGARNGASGSN